ncbi:MAG: hypothetical protein IPN93_08220 [Bacteroidetes bacterium]|nr:hypothetical protein [Bacteroidota bacterium]
MEKYYSIKDNHNDELVNIFTNPEFKNISVIENGFHTVNNVLHDCILFISVNPSLKDDSKKNEYYDLPKTKNETFQENGSSSFFTKFYEIAQYYDKDELCSHIDLLVFRNTNQRDIDSILNEKSGPKFIMSQLEISKKIMEVIKPKIIVVCNSKSRIFLGFDKSKDKNVNVWMDYDFEFKEELGTYIITNSGSKLHNTPVFFSSMLNGQRALDKGSFRRLIWHINAVKNKNELIKK